MASPLYPVIVTGKGFENAVYVVGAIAAFMLEDPPQPQREAHIKRAIASVLARIRGSDLFIPSVVISDMSVPTPALESDTQGSFRDGAAAFSTLFFRLRKPARPIMTKLS
jgi:hypothetical protein